MNILMISHSYVVGLNRRLCRELARVGGEAVKVTAVAPSWYHGDLRPVLLEPLTDEPYRLEPVSAWFSRFPHIFLYGSRLRSLLRGDWDVIHAWEEPYILAGGQIAWGMRPDATLVYSTFQNQPKRYPLPFRWVEQYCLERASGWTAFGRTVAEALKSRPGYIDRRMRVIPLGVDLDVFIPDSDVGRRVRTSLGWTNNGPPVVGYLGRFVPEKGIELLMRVLDRLPRGSWRALIVGGGWLEGSLRTWAAFHGDAVRVVVGVPHNGVPAYLNAMDMLAAPSQTTRRWKEQLGRMLLEAMACGVPIVASNSGEIPYVIADAGLVVPEADEEVWSRTIGTLIDDPCLRRNLARCGLDRVHDVYAWPQIARQFLDFFHELRDRDKQKI